MSSSERSITATASETEVCITGTVSATEYVENG